MAEFYHELVTEKSYKILQDLRRGFSFVLIGGWAVFLYTKALKSKDIDILVDYNELEKMRSEFSVSKNDRLKKYEIKIDEVDVDIYLPFYSNLGLPVEEIKKYVRSVEGFMVPSPEMLLLLKTYVAKARQGSAKGRKDMIDIFSLIKELEINWKLFKEIAQKHNLQMLLGDLKDMISNEKEIFELYLSAHALARLKKDVLAKLNS